MNYIQYIKNLNEVRLGSYKYRVPDSKKEQMFDFYMLTTLISTDDVNIDMVIQEAKETLYSFLKQELLDVLMFGISSEVRHFEDAVSGPLNPSDTIDDYEIMDDFYKYRNELYSDEDADKKFNIDKRFKTSDFERIVAYVAFKELIPDEGNRAYFAKDIFKNYGWDEDFGGEAWVKICNGWLKLNDAKTIGEMQVWIDHVYDLQHNSDTVFQKVESYSMDRSFNWIRRALDLKAAAKTPQDFFTQTSYSMQKLAGFVIKANSNDSQEMWQLKEDLWKKLKHNIVQDDIKNVKRILRQHGKLIDLDKRYDDNRTLIFDSDAEILKILLKHGANPNIRKSGGNTALWMVVYHYNTYNNEKIKVLLDNGADPDIPDKLGDADNRTPLFYACVNDAIYIAELLLKYKANPNIADSSGDTCLIVAKSTQVLKLLLDNGAESDVQNDEGFTALMMACKQRDIEKTKLLLKHGADPNITNERDCTALFFAWRRGDLGIVKLLLDNNADPNIIDVGGDTVLNHAQATDDPKMVELLKSYGATSE